MRHFFLFAFLFWATSVSHGASCEHQALEKLIQIFSYNFGVDPETVTRDSDIRVQFELEDVDLVEILAEIENEFGVEISRPEASKIRLVRDIIPQICGEK